MLQLAISFAVLVVLRWLAIRWQARRPDQPFRTALQKELAAWAIVLAVFVVGFVVLFAAAEVFGPIPQVHEW